MEKLCVLLVLLSVLKLATCWTCYVCTSSQVEGCEPFNSSVVPVLNCDTTFGPDTGCAAFTLTDADEKVSQTTRSCAMWNDTAKVTCDDIKKEVEAQQGVKLKSCNVCNSDLCNSATVKEGAVIWILAGIFALILARC